MGCGQCPANLLGAVDDPEVVQALNRVGVWLGLVWAVLLVAVAGWRLLRSTAATRRRDRAGARPRGRLPDPGRLGASSTPSTRGFLGNDALDRRLWLGQAAALVALALGVAWEWVRGRRTRSALARLVVELAASPPPGGLEAALARTLGDPSLKLLYPLPDGRRIDAAGRPAEPGQGQAVTPLVRGGRPVALLAHRPGLLDDPGWSRRSPPPRAWRSTTSGSRRRSVPSSRTCAASRARIVERGDAERRRLERDLHDGAQQRLVSLALSLRLARLGGDTETDVAALEEAEAEVRQALAELRGLAHGLYPAALAEEGLGAALEALAEQASSPLALGRLPRGAPRAEGRGRRLLRGRRDPEAKPAAARQRRRELARTDGWSSRSSRTSRRPRS